MYVPPIIKWNLTYFHYNSSCLHTKLGCCLHFTAPFPGTSHSLFLIFNISQRPPRNIPYSYYKFPFRFTFSLPPAPAHFNYPYFHFCPASPSPSCFHPSSNSDLVRTSYFYIFYSRRVVHVFNLDFVCCRIK